MLFIFGRYGFGKGRRARLEREEGAAALWLSGGLTVWLAVAWAVRCFMPDTVSDWYFETGFAAAVAVAGIAVFVWKLFRYGVCDLAVLLALALAVWASVATLDAAARMQAL